MVPLLITQAAIYAGAPPFLSTLSVIVLFLWAWFAHQEGPAPEQDPTYDYLRKMRVKLYVVGLLFYLFLNLALVAYSPVVASVAFLVIWPIRASILIGIYVLLLRGNKAEINPKAGDELHGLTEMAVLTGTSTINLTWVMQFVDILLALPEVFTTGYQGVYGLVLSLTLIAWFANRAFNMEVQAREYARSLADSLNKRNWWAAAQRRRARSGKAP